jgi:thymidylate kinase
VRRGYLSLAKKEPHRVKVIDTRQGEEKVYQRIRQIVDGLIGFKGSSLPAVGRDSRVQVK